MLGLRVRITTVVGSGLFRKVSLMLKAEYMTSLVAASNYDGFDSCGYPWNRAFTQSPPWLCQNLVARIGLLWQGLFPKYVVLRYVREHAVWPLVSALKRKEAASIACCNEKALLSQDSLHNFSDFTFIKRLHYGDIFSLYVYPSTHHTHSIQFVQSINLSSYSSILPFVLSTYLVPGVAKWLRRCATSRTVPGSIPGGVTGDYFRGSLWQNHVPWGQLKPLKMSTRDFSRGKGGRCLELTTYHPCIAESQEIRGLNLPGTPRATSACRGTPLLYFFTYILTQLHTHTHTHTSINTSTHRP